MPLIAGHDTDVGPTFGRRAFRSVMQRHRVYGITIETDVPLLVRLPPSNDPPDVRFELGADAPDEADLAGRERVYTEGLRPDGRPHFEYWSLTDRDVVRIVDVMDFHCWPDRIYCHLYGPRHRYLLEVGLFGLVLALWLERRGTRALHGAAAVVDGQGVAFLADAGAGKTSTAAACVAAGLPMLSDDLLALEERDGAVYARPGYPQFRMWPEQARHFVGTAEGHDQIHPSRTKLRIDVGTSFGIFQNTPVPLRRIYLPHRLSEADASVEIEPIRPRGAMVALLRHSFLPVETARFGMHAERLEFLARVLWRVPVRRLGIPEGLDQLPRVVAEIVADVRADAS
jgi:hypothetical protein